MLSYRHVKNWKLRTVELRFWKLLFFKFRYLPLYWCQVNKLFGIWGVPQQVSLSEPHQVNIVWLGTDNIQLWDESHNKYLQLNLLPRNNPVQLLNKSESFQSHSMEWCELTSLRLIWAGDTLMLYDAESEAWLFVGLFITLKCDWH